MSRVSSFFFFRGEWLLLRGIDLSTKQQTGVGDGLFSRLVNFGKSEFVVSSNLITKLVHLI